MKRVRQLEAEKTVADAHVRDADAHLQSALLLVSAEERAVKQAVSMRHAQLQMHETLFDQYWTNML